MKIVLLGPPFAGKGTQGELLAGKLHLPRLSVGALIRKLYHEKKTEGIEASKFMLAGEAIPGDLLLLILKPWFAKHPEGFVVDNLVRNEDQISAFDRFAKETNFHIDHVIYLRIPKDEIQKRYKTRIEEDKRDHRLREDEIPQVVARRIEVYETSRNLVLDYFRKHSKVHELSGNHSVQKVHEDIIRIVGAGEVDE